MQPYLPDSICAHCSAPFRPKGQYRGRPPRKYCSNECRFAARAVQPWPCGACGEVFKPAFSGTKFCSRSCQGADYALRFKGEGSHFWRGGATTANKLIRSSADYARWRTAVFERDGYRCVECGAGGELHADHIKPLSARPDLALDLDNGRALCVPCHRATETWGPKLQAA